MRLCVSVPCFFPGEELTAALKKISAIGFDAAEIYDWRGLDFDTVKNACAETGVELLSMCTTEFCMTDPALRSQWLAGLQQSCNAAEKMGVRRLITQVGSDTGAPRQKQHESILAALQQAVPILEQSGVVLMLEPLNTRVDHPGYYLHTSEEGFKIIRETNHPLVKMVYDIYHQQIMEGNIIPSITNHLDCIEHLHSAGHPGRHELQYGENDYHFIFSAVDKSGYTGACGLEYLPLLPPEESLARTRELYAPCK